MARRRRKTSGAEVLFVAVAAGAIMLYSLTLGRFVSGQVWLIGLGALMALITLGAAAASLFLKSRNRPVHRVRATSKPTGGAARAATDATGGTPRPTEWSLDLLQQLEWKRFEALCAAYFNAAGGLIARTTRLGADGGVDIYLYGPASPDEAPAGVVQCKAWRTYRVGVKPVRELYGVMAAEKARIGIFVTTGDYTAEAREFAREKHLQLLTGRELLDKLRALPSETAARLLAEATAGDYTTPTCPQCGIKMTQRTPRKGGSPFWGCMNYPRCRQTLRQSARQGAASA